MHMEELSFPLIHAFQANTLTKKKFQDPPFTRNHSSTNQTTSPLTTNSGSYGFRPWVTKMIPCLLDI